MPDNFADDVLRAGYSMDCFTARGGRGCAWRCSSGRVSAAVRCAAGGGPELRRNSALDLSLQIELPFKSLQIDQKIFRSLIALFEIFGQCFSDDAFEFRRRFPIVTRQRWRFFIEYKTDDFTGC